MKSKRHKICARMRKAKERKRLESPAPDYPQELPELRRKIIIINYESGKPEKHIMNLYKSDRIDCFRVEVDGKPWKNRIGFSKILAGIRKALPRTLSLKSL